MDKFSRSVRRHHVERLKKNRKGYWGRGGVRWWDVPMDNRNLGMVVHTPALCSCFMCGNARKHQKERTIQERRWMQDICL